MVVANIIGAGIFNSTGYQAAALGSGQLIFLVWIAGGVLAVCGALCYGELGAAMPEAGGEYVYLRETYGGVFAFASAFVSLIAGFSAPIASAAKGLVRYLSQFFPILEDDPQAFGLVSVNDLVAVGVVWLLVLIHSRVVQRGLRFNDFVTLFKVAGIVAIIVSAAAVGKGSLRGFSEVSTAYAEQDAFATSAAFATSLIFVLFCFCGWNAAAYVASELNEPQRDLPRALLLGTGAVLFLYLGLNSVYLYGAGIDELAAEANAGRSEVGLFAARRLFGPWGVNLMTLVIATSILASASAMTIAGPRVYYALGRDYRLFAWLGRSSPSTGAPTTALVVQGAVTSVIILLGRIDEIMLYAGFTLTLFSALAVSCVIVLRFTRPQMERPFRTWGYPVTPLLFLGVSCWTMVWAFRDNPGESTLALLTVVAGGVLYQLFGFRPREHDEE